jgi:hypothetical protein
MLVDILTKYLTTHQFKLNTPEQREGSFIGPTPRGEELVFRNSAPCALRKMIKRDGLGQVEIRFRER